MNLVFSILLLAALAANCLIQFYFSKKSDSREKERHFVSLEIQRKQLEAWSSIEKAATAYKNEHTWEPYKEVDSDDEE
ncbi:hypothetical protein P7G51_08095 [Enterococcus asini]|uniref:hypothetical protein n=1 Tax=Enterococcus asini TaxID=57732 RepID=UPI00288F5CAF|nr:hypothetical protein [Enterococcus asini]MDT2757340.1 hypothetical protein [Enterococcus asini]